MTSDEFLKECKETIHKRTENMKGGSISLSTLLFGIFLTLKLCGVIAWSWWWIFAPLWIPFAFIILVLLLIFVIGLKLFLQELRDENSNNHTGGSSEDEEILG
jgi:uncharacterized membrane protein